MHENRHLKPEVRGKTAALVVPPDEMHAMRVCHLQSQEVQQHLATELSTIYVISQEQVTAKGNRPGRWSWGKVLGGGGRRRDKTVTVSKYYNDDSVHPSTSQIIHSWGG